MLEFNAALSGRRDSPRRFWCLPTGSVSMCEYGFTVKNVSQRAPASLVEECHAHSSAESGPFGFTPAGRFSVFCDSSLISTTVV